MAFFGAVFLCLWSFIRRALPRLHWKAMPHVERGRRRAEIECFTENKLSTSRKSHIHSQLSVPTCRSTPKAIVLVSPRSPPKVGHAHARRSFYVLPTYKRAALNVRYPGARKAPPLWWISPSECTFCMIKYHTYSCKMAATRVFLDSYTSLW